MRNLPHDLLDDRRRKCNRKLAADAGAKHAQAYARPPKFQIASDHVIIEAHVDTRTNFALAMGWAD